MCSLCKLLLAEIDDILAVSLRACRVVLVLRDVRLESIDDQTSVDWGAAGGLLDHDLIHRLLSICVILAITEAILIVNSLLLWYGLGA